MLCSALVVSLSSKTWPGGAKFPKRVVAYEGRKINHKSRARCRVLDHVDTDVDVTITDP